MSEEINIDSNSLPDKTIIRSWIKDNQEKIDRLNEKYNKFGTKWAVNTIMEAFENEDIIVTDRLSNRTEEAIRDSVSDSIVVDDDNVHKDVRADLYKLYDVGLVRTVSIDNDGGSWTYFYFTLEIPDRYL